MTPATLINWTVATIIDLARTIYAIGGFVALGVATFVICWGVPWAMISLWSNRRGAR
ncbi:MAG: hypothetical protein KGL39_51960 [Patescibacteria group bacterium]|nr:hypothetical protein [Patescibacteria group bacterium]